MDETIIIREMLESDCVIISHAFVEQGWNKPESKYRKYFQESIEGKRVVLLGKCDGEFAGYLTIVWDSDHPAFKTVRIPEIVDFNVLKKFRCRGIGTALMAEAEKRISERSAVSGIGVGLTADYGAAQILYVKRGYVPDGRGIFQNGKPLQYGDQAKINDDLTLYLTKVLR